MDFGSKERFKTLVIKLCLTVIIGIFAGIVGTVFSKSITVATELRGNFSWLHFLLPLGGILSLLIFKYIKANGQGTNQVIESCVGETKVSKNLTPAIFLATVISHLFGASVGREGAALQLGGGTAVFVSDLFHRDENERRLFITVGMAAFFSVVFGTPLAASVFAIEIANVGRPCIKRLPFTFSASFIAFFTSLLLKAHPERFALESVPRFSFYNVGKTVLVAVVGAALGIVICFSLRYGAKLFKKLINNAYVRIAVGGAVLVLLTVIIGNYDYNGAGVFVIERIFETGEVSPFAFLLKLLFTVVAVSSGFKGGEIVPTLFIGATFGAVAAIVLRLPVAFGAAVGMTALFCGVTNCPIASVLLAAEMFSFKGIGFMAVAAAVSFVFSGRISLYSAQNLPKRKNILIFFKNFKTDFKFKSPL